MEQGTPKDIDRERADYAINQLKKLNFNPEIVSPENENIEINFLFNGNIIKLFPYTGWFQGKGVKPNRGIAKLIKQLKTPIKNEKPKKRNQG